MKNKYNQYGAYVDISSYQSYDQTYGDYTSVEFNDLINNIYKEHFETKEDRLKREAKEKAQNRNNKIDQILGE
jgi:uncharacterized protein YaaW (UPF0174 family)